MNLLPTFDSSKSVLFNTGITDQCFLGVSNGCTIFLYIYQSRACSSQLLQSQVDIALLHFSNLFLVRRFKQAKVRRNCRLLVLVESLRYRIYMMNKALARQLSRCNTSVHMIRKLFFNHNIINRPFAQLLYNFVQLRLRHHLL